MRDKTYVVHLPAHERMPLRTLVGPRSARNAGFPVGGPRRNALERLRYPKAHTSDGAGGKSAWSSARASWSAETSAKAWLRSAYER